MIEQILSFSIPKPETEPDLESPSETAYQTDTLLREILRYLHDSANRTLIEESLITFRDYRVQ